MNCTSVSTNPSVFGYRLRQRWSHMVAARRYPLPSAPCSTRASASLLLALRALGSAPPSRRRLLGRIPACIVISYRHATRVINSRLRVAEPKGFAPPKGTEGGGRSDRCPITQGGHDGRIVLALSFLLLCTAPVSTRRRLLDKRTTFLHSLFSIQRTISGN